MNKRLLLFLWVACLLFFYPFTIDAQEGQMAVSSSSPSFGSSSSQKGVATTTQASNQILSLLSSQGKILYGNEPNSIMVIDYPDNIQRISEFLDNMDIPPLQVGIEARVVEVKLEGEHALGVNWSLMAEHTQGVKVGASRIQTPIQNQIPYKSTKYPPGTGTAEATPFNLTITDDNLNFVLQTLSNHLKTNILSAPRITTVNNREAEIKIVKNLPWAEPQVTVSNQGITVTWESHFEEVGIKLKVKPTITNDGNISMILTPDISEYVSDYSLNVLTGGTPPSITYTIPVIDKRTATTKVVIGNNQTLIIGGLIKDKDTKGMTKIPLLGDIPFLGKLFASSKDTKDKMELFIFVSPTIINSEEFKRHAREERFGLAREFVADRDKNDNRTQTLAGNERLRRQAAARTAVIDAEKKAQSQETQRQELIKMLRELNMHQNSLSSERKKIQESLSNEAAEFKKLRTQEDALIQQRKGLEQMLKGGALNSVINGK